MAAYFRARLKMVVICQMASFAGKLSGERHRFTPLIYEALHNRP